MAGGLGGRQVKPRGALWALGIAIPILVGAFLGSGLFTFVSAHGTSYLSNDPAVCVNCHVMREQYEGWLHSSHHAAAVCNDCHLPHESAIGKLYVKASNGYHHSRAFTLMDFHDPIQIKPGNAEVLEANCIRCHAALVNDITAHGGLSAEPRGGLYGCVKCHPGVGHGR
ncbi:cytochrome c nitrite reductase small subunit [Mesoterricola sediminis]|uniref:Cytochrome c nitrite reductase small subunit n=1 Tax=Mesoterricola sediminis TaxID=2927980 RepID=A0AA48KF79_9BACT|nr:cytochrome c nitrite reductase small subunit [Mesoterricola sediminis]BDU78785.1 cytochrome c nitrite reductase small subunit [Mesoterricola sediminis]